jgi:hypothetical protein
MIRTPITISALALLALIACNSASPTNGSSTSTDANGTKSGSNTTVSGRLIDRVWTGTSSGIPEFQYISGLYWLRNADDLILQSSQLGIVRINAETGKTVKVYDTSSEGNFSVSNDETKLAKNKSYENPLIGLEPSATFMQPIGYARDSGSGRRPFAWNRQGTAIAGIEGYYYSAGLTIWDSATGAVQKRLTSGMSSGGSYNSSGGFTDLAWAANDTVLFPTPKFGSSIRSLD